MAVLTAYWILFAVVLSTLAVTHCKYDIAPGTQRIHDEETRKEMSRQRTMSRRSPSPMPMEGGSAAAAASAADIQVRSRTPTQDVSKTSSMAKAASRFEPAVLSFSNITYSVKVPADGAAAAGAKEAASRMRSFGEKRKASGYRGEDRTSVNSVVSSGQEGEDVDLTLLRGISGVARPRRMICLMGASGAGKTTLMDVLAGRKT